MENRITVIVYLHLAQCLQCLWPCKDTSYTIVVQEEELYDTSIMHGHSGTSDLFYIWFGVYTVTAKTTFRDDI